MSFLTRIEARAMYLLAPISPVLCSRWRFRRTFGRRWISAHPGRSTKS